SWTIRRFIISSGWSGFRFACGCRRRCCCGNIAKRERAADSHVDCEETRPHAVVSRNQLLPGRGRQIEISKTSMSQIFKSCLRGRKRRTLCKQSIAVGVAARDDVE